MKKKTLNTISVIIIIIGFIYLLTLVLFPIEELETAIQILGVSIILGVFLSGAIYQVLKNNK